MKKYDDFINEDIDLFGYKAKRREKELLRRKSEREKKELLAKERSDRLINTEKNELEFVEIAKQYNIGEIFSNLTSITVPHGKESLIEKFLPDGFQKDFFGNYFYSIGESNTMFCCHLDTANSGESRKVYRKFRGSIVGTNGETLLGADDKAGAAIMINMINHNKPGLYYFFLGEEKGMIGSRALAKYLEKNIDNDVFTEKQNKIYNNINKVIAFDRKGKDNLITKQMGQRCCSDEFADDLISQFKKFGLTYRKDPTGMYTDSYALKDIYSECINLSVGYEHQHSPNEIQDLDFLDDLADACLKLDWDKLTVVRNVKKSNGIDLTKYAFFYGDDYDMELVLEFLVVRGYDVHNYEGVQYDKRYPFFKYDDRRKTFIQVTSAAAKASGRKVIYDISELE